MKLEYPSEDDIRHVALNMRDSDFREFIALTKVDTRDALAEQLAQRLSGHPDIICAYDGARPASVGGLIEQRPRVITLMMFATDEFPLVGKALTKVLVKDLIPGAKRTGVHRIEAVSIVGHTEAHRWIQHLGLALEGEPMRGYGKDGEAYQSFAWVSDAL